MAEPVKQELIFVTQIILGIFIAFLIVRFMFVFSNSYSSLPAIAVLLGAFIFYLSITRKRELVMFMFTCLFVGTAFSFIY